MVGLSDLGEMVGSGSIYPGLLMSDNSTGGWIGDSRDGGTLMSDISPIGFYLSWSTDLSSQLQQMVGLVIGEMVESGSIYLGLLMSDNSTDGWIGDRRPWWGRVLSILVY